MERLSAWAEFQPGLRFQARFVKPGRKFQRNMMAVSRISPHFQISARAETSPHVIATKFQSGLQLAMQSDPK